MLVKSSKIFYAIFAFTVAGLSIVVGIQKYREVRDQDAIIIFTKGEPVKIYAEYARTAPEQEKGLKDRPSLPGNAGLLFIFPDETPRSFWMKEVLIPLDLIFMDEKGRIIETASLLPCSEDPCVIYNSKKPAKYVLEVNAGAVSRWKISEGDIAALPKF